MAGVYIADEVAGVLALHPYLSDPQFRAMPIARQIDRQARVVQKAHGAQDPRVLMHLMCWWTGAIGQSKEAVMRAPFDHNAARETLAREYGFADWQTVAALGDLGVDIRFEQALDAVVCGNTAALGQMLREDPTLATAQSRYGHNATLLHYLGANGVETQRQQTPLNAAELAQILIDAGSDPHAKAGMYGGGQTAFALAQTSAHPFNAGVMDDLLVALKV